MTNENAFPKHDSDNLHKSDLDECFQYMQCPRHSSTKMVHKCFLPVRKWETG
jgi:hypothetical protein